MLRNERFTLCLLLAALVVAGCSKAGDEGETAGKVPVAFAVATKPDATSRIIAGEVNTGNIRSMGVFAYYTGAVNYDDSFAANFMNDQEISRTGTQPWRYSPVKYWPNAAGEKITFFAYSPHSSHFTEKDPTPSPMPPNYLPGGTFDMELSPNLPVLKIAPRLQAEKQTDVLIARSVMNRTKTAGQIAFQFGHLLAKAVFKVSSTEQIRIDRINIRGMSTYGRINYAEDGTFSWNETGIERDKVFYSLPNKDVLANVTTTVSTFFMIPYSLRTQDCLLDVYYTNVDGITREEKTNVSFGYVPTSSGDTVEYTIGIEGGAKITVGSTAIDPDWPSSPDYVGGDDEVSAI